MILILVSLSYALQISGTALLASKIIGLSRKKIIDRAAGNSVSIILNKNKESFIMKENYIAILNENFSATTGLIWVTLGIIINILNSEREFNSLYIILLSIALSIAIYLLTNYISDKIVKVYTKKWDNYIKLDFVPNGTSAVMMDFQNEKE